MSQSDDLSPSLAPENEAELPSDPTFVDACMTRIAQHAEQFGWRFGNSTLTRSDHWGLVWRVDFKTKDGPAESPFVNRVVCWQRPGDSSIAVEFAFGQRVERLK